MMSLRQCLLSGAISVGIVASATSAFAGVCDLSVARSTCDPAAFGGVYFTNGLPSGTFTVDPFLKIRANTTESGYNTSGDYNPGTNPKDYQFNQTGGHDLLLSQVPIVTIGSTEYREFFLAIDEPGGSPQLSLDQLQIFLSPTGNLTNYDTTTRTLNGLTAVYDLDAGGDNWIKLSYQVGTISGPGTMLVYIPNYLFTQSGAQYVYLYSQFGSQATSGGGLEEFWVRTTSGGTSVTRVPEPGVLMLFGTATLLLGSRLRRRFR